jgi:group I intron endonuclease
MAIRKRTGIYKISCLATNDFYIGSSVSIKARFNRHKSDLRKNRHSSPILQNAYNKYGENSFVFEIIELCDRSELIKKEQYYLDTLKPKYNILKIAYEVPVSPWTEERRKKMSERQKGTKYNLGKPWSVERLLDRLSDEDKNKPVMAKHKNTGETKIFSSLHEAHKAGYSKQEIKRHMKGRRKAYCKYVWTFIEENK